jgi:hypothetical protein
MADAPTKKPSRAFRLRRERALRLKRERDKRLKEQAAAAPMEPPIGFATLPEAVDKVRKVLGSSKVKRELAVKPAIAEACADGRIAAAYRSLAGADELDPRVWRMPHWRSYLETGAINLDLPLVDDSGRPHPHNTIRCAREIFVRRDDLTRFITELAPAAPTTQPPAPAPSESVLVPAPAPSRARKVASPQTYAAHQRDTLKRTGWWATRKEDDSWAKQNHYAVNSVRDDLRREFFKALPLKDRAKIRKGGRRR